MMMPLALSRRVRRALVLATGQTTSYGSGTGVDDGALEIGERHRYTVLTTGQYSGTVNITLNGKTDVHSNACVMDDATGLMWTRTVSASVGPTSNGLLPWTTNANGEGIFTYAAAANAALLAGHGNDPDPLKNWRIPFDTELLEMRNMEQPTGAPGAEFPTIAGNYWSSTTRPDATTFANIVLFGAGYCAPTLKTSAAYSCWLVRGPL